jgi:hypothetical protein
MPRYAQTTGSRGTLNRVKVEDPPVVHTPAEFLPEIPEEGWGTEWEYGPVTEIDLGKVCQEVVEDLVRDSKSTQVGGTHYAEMSVQPWEAMRAWMSPAEYIGYHVGTIVGYLSRHKAKGGEQDLHKAGHHMDELRRYLKKDEEYPW